MGTPDAASGPIPISFEGNPDSVAGYIGSGDILIDGMISEDSDFCGFGDGSFPPPDNGTCTLFDNLDLLTALTYDFAPIPEPPSLWVFVTSVLIIGGFGALTTWRTAGTIQRS